MMKNSLSFLPASVPAAARFKLVLGALALSLGLSGCFPLVVGGAMVGTASVVSDRRTSGAQLEDEALELKGASRLRESLGERAHINVNSYNRQILLTGEVASAADKQLAEQVVSRLENVRGVFNELAVLASSSLSQRSTDVLVTGRVKAALIDAKDIFSSSFNVVTERGTTYLMGIVTKREADRATEIVRGVTGVQRVVRVLEIVSEDELRRLQPPPTHTEPTTSSTTRGGY
jgi:osmotically-inducible protein OsmY